MKYTEEMRQFISNNVKGISNAELAGLFNKRFHTNVTTSQIKAYKANHHLSSGLTGHFVKGQPSHNKGKKGIHYLGSEKGWFSRGHMPHNHKPVGSERISKDGYVEVKVAEPKKWRLKHNVIWENANGKIPKKV